MNKQSKIYVAGHRGLVGSAIYRELKKNGYENLIGRSHRELDLLDAAAVKDFFDQEQPEYVFLAAAFVGGILANSTYRADFIYRNLGIQQNVIGESFRHGVKKLLFLGSTCIYPKNAEQPIKEEALLSSPLEYTNEPYAIAKIAGLKMCESFNLQFDCNYLAVMPTNLYGPNDNFDLETSHVLPAMIRKIFLAKALKENNWETIRQDLSRRPLSNIEDPSSLDHKSLEHVLKEFGIEKERLILWGSGKPLREFMWSEDMASACIYIMEHCDFEQVCPQKTSGCEIRNCHINIGTGEELSIRDLAQLIARKFNYPAHCICFDKTHPDGTMRKLCDPSKLHKLGWRHQVNLNEGISRLCSWYLDSLTAG